MKALISILVIVAAIWGIRGLLLMYERTEKKASQGIDSTAPLPPPVPSAELTGLPAGLEPGLQTAQREGPTALQKWLKSYRIHLQDPRLAAIELDYVIMVSSTDLKEARRVFAEVKRRVPPSSPVYSRVKALERTYE